MKVVLVLLLLTTAAFAAEVSTTTPPAPVPAASPLPAPSPAQLAPPHTSAPSIFPYDASNITNICQMALGAPSVTLEQKTSVGMYCQDLLRRLASVPSVEQPSPGGGTGASATPGARPEPNFTPRPTSTPSEALK